eukprot:TRINITY_DN8903_c0_g1_i1.p1 TRINITY_DN8903_c0_g1~~TRINITY_DN8903_c0_g1_i1.p1  ORF type:complete len:467 (+),score=111.20 TRINITY_DN8903_c0_g1_i1:248-1648(+)
MESEPDASDTSPTAFAGIDDVPGLLSAMHMVTDPSEESSYSTVHALILLSKAIQSGLVDEPYSIRHESELPAELSAALGGFFRKLTQLFGRLPLTERVFCMTVDSNLGASLCLKYNVMELLVDNILNGNNDVAIASLFSFCCVLHCPVSRDAFVAKVAQLPLLPRLIEVLKDYTATPSWSNFNHAHLLALNWLGGGALGSRMLIPYIPDIVQALHAEGHTPRVTLLLCLANLPAYMDEDADALNELRNQGIVAPLVASVEGRNIAQGCVGALMGLLNMRAHVGSDVAFEMDMQLTEMLVACLQCALRSESQDNILWSPNHPAQAMAAMALRPDYIPLLVQSGALPLLVDIIRPTDTGKQAEPDRDELMAVKAIRAIAQRADYAAHVPDVAEYVLRVYRDGMTPEAKAVAQEAAEALGVTSIAMSLQMRCRQVVRQTLGQDFEVYTERVRAEGLPEHTERYLLYDRF